MADYTPYIINIGDTDYPTTFNSFRTAVGVDMSAAEADILALQSLIAALGGGGLTSDLKLNDGLGLVLGTGDDTRLYHSGANTYIDHSGIGDLILLNTTNSIILGNTVTTLNGNLTVSGNIIGNLTLASGASLTLTSGSITLTSGALTLTSGSLSLVNGDIMLRDNKYIYIGTGNDLKLRHDATNSYIANATGILYIDNTTASAYTYIRNGASVIGLRVGGSTNTATLYYNGAQKLITTAAGITITGTATATTFIGDLTGNATTADTATNVAYSGLTGTVPTWNQNTTGNAATATSWNSSRTIALSGGASGSGSSINGSPTINVTALTASYVGAALAGQVAGSTAGVGTFVFAHPEAVGTGGSMTVGAALAGASLSPATANGISTVFTGAVPATLVGSWKCMGYSINTTTENGTTVWMRYA